MSSVPPAAGPAAVAGSADGSKFGSLANASCRAATSFSASDRLCAVCSPSGFSTSSFNTTLELLPKSKTVPSVKAITITPSPVTIFSFSATVSPMLKMRSVPSSAIALTIPVTDCTVPTLAMVFLRSVGFYILNNSEYCLRLLVYLLY